MACLLAVLVLIVYLWILLRPLTPSSVCIVQILFTERSVYLMQKEELEIKIQLARELMPKDFKIYRWLMNQG